MPRLATLALLLLTSTSAVLAAAPPVPLATPEGWRTETIPFPLSFAPDLAYEGVEELRFAPGMFRPEAEDYFTYGFAWALHGEVGLDPERLGADLVRYFEGLAAAVRRSKELPELALDLEATLTRQGEALVGTVEAFDAFASQQVVPLRVRIRPMASPAGYASALWFELSPQAFDHPVWRTLSGIVPAASALVEEERGRPQ